MEIFSAFWILCGFLAYGMIKGNWRRLAVEHGAPYDYSTELMIWQLTLAGPLGLATAMLVSPWGEKFNWCLWMPTKLWAPKTEISLLIVGVIGVVGVVSIEGIVLFCSL